jgi:hypothetical protein
MRYLNITLLSELEASPLEYYKHDAVGALTPNCVAGANKVSFAPPSNRYFCSGNLNPMYVPELIPISPSNVVLNSGMLKLLYTDETKMIPSTIVHAKI